MWESSAESGRQVGQLRATERKLDPDAEGSSRRESDILGSRLVSRPFSFHALTPAAEGPMGRAVS